MVSELDIEKLVNGIDIVEVINEYVSLKKSGSGYKGLSPFKEENTPSFSVSPQKKIFKDFSSGIGGNVIYFYSKINNISFQEACVELAKKYNIDINLAKISKKKSKYDKLYSILVNATEYFSKTLLNSNRALEYLAKRGYTKEDILKYSLGFADDKWDGLINHLSSNYTLEEIETVGLLSKSQQSNKVYDAFRDRIIFPIFNIKRQIIGFGGRDISGKEGIPKYINSKETVIFKKSNELYGIFDAGETIKNFQSCILVEGFFDVLALHRSDIKNTVASLGTSLTESQAKLLSKLTTNIVIAYDNDTAGLEAKIRAIYILNKYGFNIKIMNLGQGVKDPDELIHKYGKKAFVDQYSESIDAIDFMFDYLSKDLDLSLISAKMELINRFKPYFSSIASEIHYGLYLEKLHRKLNISISALETELKAKFKKQEKVFVDVSKNKDENKPKRQQLEELTINLVFNNRDYLPIFLKFIFKDHNLAEIYNKLKNNENLTAEEFNLLLDISTSNSVILNNDSDVLLARLYRGWVLDYIAESIKYINKSNLDTEKYAEYLSLLNKYKSLKNNTDFKSINEVFDQFLEYEEGISYDG